MSFLTEVTPLTPRASSAALPMSARLLLRYTLALIGQITQTAACNRFHSVEQQMCRLVLSCLDRMPSNELAMTQELLADTLGVRREGITEAAGRLQAAGVIQYARGHIVVLDRPRLEARACECYAAVKRECERLLPRDEDEIRFLPDTASAVVRGDPLHFVLRAEHHRDPLM